MMLWVALSFVLFALLATLAITLPTPLNVGLALLSFFCCSACISDYNRTH
jgi:hypothetical protein